MTQNDSAITQDTSIATRNLSLVVLLRACQYPLLALYVTLVPRTMGPEVYGQYALIMSIIAMLVSITDLGVTEICGRFIPQFVLNEESARIRQLCSSFVSLKVTVNLIVALILLPLLYLIYHQHLPVAHFILISLILLTVDLGGIASAVLFGLNKLGKYSSRDPIRRGLGLALLLVLFHYYGLFGAVLSILLVEAFLAWLYLVWTREYLPSRIDWNMDLRCLSPFMKFGFMFYVSWALLNVWHRLGNVLIQYITNDLREVALFDVANQIFLVSGTLSLFVISSFIPMFTKFLLTQKEERLIDWSQSIVKYIGVLATILFWAFVLTGPTVIPPLIGAEYESIYGNGVVLLAGILPTVISQLGYVLAVVYGEPIKYLRSLAFALMAFLVISTVLIQKYASMGCAVATFISCVVLAVVMCIQFREKLIPCLFTYLKAFSLGFLFAPLCLVRAALMETLLLGGFCIVVYIFLLFGSGILNTGEIKEIWQAIKEKR